MKTVIKRVPAKLEKLFKTIGNNTNTFKIQNENTFEMQIDIKGS